MPESQIAMLDYEEWCEANREEIAIEAAESGADREMCFDFERLCEKKYDEYVSAR